MSDVIDFRKDRDRLWEEHGWGLRGWQVAVLVGAIIAVSLVLRLIG